KTAPAGAVGLFCPQPTCFPSFVKKSVSGSATFSQWPCKLSQPPSALVACPGGSRTSLRRYCTHCNITALALVWLTLARWVFRPVGIIPATATKQSAATPMAKVTSTRENAAVEGKERFIFGRLLHRLRRRQAE